MANILVVVEIHQNHLSVSIPPTLCAALSLGKSCDALVIGHQCEKVVEEIRVFPNIERVLVADHICYEHYLAENVAPLIAEMSSHYEYILAPSTTFGKNFMPRVAALKDVMLVSDVIKILGSNIFQRPIYAGNAIATVETLDKLKLLTIRTTAFDPLEPAEQKAPIEHIEPMMEDKRVRFLKSEIPKLERPDLTAAKIIISGGRGLQSRENFKKLETIADKLGAAIGASRAAVDAGFVPNDYQVGQTGKIVAPDLYIAIGISGAVQHLAGMKDSKIIVAINKDPEAPIFQIADYGLVSDLFDALQELETQL